MKQVPPGGGVALAVLIGIIFWCIALALWLGWEIIAPTTTDTQRCNIETLALGECKTNAIYR